MTALVVGQPYEVHELQDVRLDYSIGDAAFRIDDSKVRVIDNSEWLSRRHV